MQVREPPLGDRDVQQLGIGLAVTLALLAVQTGPGLGCRVLGQTAPDISRRNKLSGGKLPRVGNVVLVKKCLFQIFLAPLGEKCPWRRRQPGAEHLCVRCSGNDITSLLGEGVTKNLQQHFFSQANTASAH